MRNKGKHTKKYVENNKEKDFTLLADDVIIASMMCLEKAYTIASKKKDSETLIRISDKWLELYQAILPDEEEPQPMPFGFVSSIGDIDE